MSDLINKDVEYWCKNLEILQDEMEKSTSDRSCVIVAVAYFDEFLGYLFKSFLSTPSSQKEDKELFSGYGPLSSFSSKILLAYRLGLISNYEFKALQTIRKIRNEFAHNLTKDSLLEFKDKLLSLVPERQLLFIKNIPISSGNVVEPTLPVVPEVDMSSARDIFVKIVLCLANLFSSRCLDATESHRVIPSDYKSLVEINDRRICMLQKEVDMLEQIMNLKIEAIDLHNGVISRLSDLPETHNEEVEIHRAEIKRLESEFAVDHQDYERIGTLLSIFKYANGQIKKAYDKEKLI